MKIFFRNIHLYLGLASGLVIAVVCLTGAILVFEKELHSTIYPERYAVVPGGERLSLDSLVATASAAMPKMPVRSVKVYDDRARSVEVALGEGKGESRVAWMNPYTGETLAVSTSRAPFFGTVFSLHRWLLAGDTGKMIVGVSTLMFLVILITGIVLWWPKNARILKQRLTMKWSGGWKRINHDLHIVIGFYASIILFVFAFTGLAWSFEWFNDGIYLVTGSVKKGPSAPESKQVVSGSKLSFDDAYRTARRIEPASEFYSITPAKKPTDAVRVTTLPVAASHEKASEQIYLDRYSGSLLRHERYDDRSAGDRMRSLFYAVHISSVAGLPGRIIGLLVCLAGFTFPITGTILWLNRLARKKSGTTGGGRRVARIVRRRTVASDREMVPAENLVESERS